MGFIVLFIFVQNSDVSEINLDGNRAIDEVM